MRLIIEIYESNRNYPAVTHIFEGRSKAEVIQYYNAHKKYDSFFKSAIDKGNFKNIKLAVHSRWG
jgi:hypothetical protein